MGKILASEYNTWYTRLTTLQSRFGLTQTSSSKASGNPANASDMNTLLTRINNLRTNTYLNYAAQTDMVSLTVGTKIQQTKATEIDNHLTAFEQVCAKCINNATTSGTGVPSFATTAFTVTPISNTTTSFSQSCSTTGNSTNSKSCSTNSTWSTLGNSTHSRGNSTFSESCSTNNHKTNNCRTYKTGSPCGTNNTTGFDTNSTWRTYSRGYSTDAYRYGTDSTMKTESTNSTFSQGNSTTSNTTYSQTLFYTASSGFAVQRG